MQENKLTNLGDGENEIFVPEGFENIIINTAKMAYLALDGYLSIKGMEFKPWHELSKQELSHYIGRAAYFFAYHGAPTDAPHEAWKLKMQLSGFKLGSTPNEKEHPHLMPFKELPEELQVADAIFKGVVDGVISSD